MTDRELLELAARAAGMTLTYVAKYEKEWCDYRNELGGETPWNPLNDDGDALRLAVKLGLQITLWQKYARIWSDEIEAYEDYNDDPYAATRRAIVRAAAAIGEGMK